MLNIDYYSLLRQNRGLVDLLRVFTGCVYICIGTLMARRSSELDELTCDCLDKSRTRLVFFNRKSGVGGMREKIARPIPKIAVEFISDLQYLQHELIGMGIIAKKRPLLSYPSKVQADLISGTEASYRALDLFCDYFELPVDEQGRRYYIRQHQLRRFFAMLFFWGNSFGGLDTLRWFLGHTDVEHLWHYITETMTGGALSSVKAAYATERLLANGPEVSALSDFLKKKYGASAFSLMTRTELDDHLTDLLENEEVVIEPEFFVGGSGKEFRILATVTSKPLNA